MVAIATLLGKNGLQSWLLQRLSAIILGVYLCWVLAFWLQIGVDFAAWQAFMHSTVGRPAALLSLLALLIHSWIGIWTVTTDYLPAVFLRLSVQVLSILALIVYCYWGIKIICL